MPVAAARDWRKRLSWSCSAVALITVILINNPCAHHARAS
jgi:hypothetical protein